MLIPFEWALLQRVLSVIVALSDEIATGYAAKSTTDANRKTTTGCD
ncbi:MAG: hypothetical protein QM739_16895 [Propionivibrio sp.]